MARSIKTGLSYFPLDVDFFEDEKIQFVSSKFGIKGEIITLRLLTRIYRNGYYIHWDEDTALLFSKVVGDSEVSHGLANNVVYELVKRGFFDKSIFDRFSVLTSRGIQIRYLDACRRRKIVEIEETFLLIDDDEKPENLQVLVKCAHKQSKCMHNVNINPENVNINPQNVNIGTQSKVKKSKVKESKVKQYSCFSKLILEFTGNKNLQDALNKFIEYRKQIRKPISEYALSLLLGDLSKLSKDANIQTAIVNKSIMSGWQGFFPLKDNFQNKQYQKHDDSWERMARGEVID